MLLDLILFLKFHQSTLDGMRWVVESAIADLLHPLEEDLWIAATAIKHGLPILSNDGVFRRIKGLTVLPP